MASCHVKFYGLFLLRFLSTVCPFCCCYGPYGTSGPHSILRQRGSTILRVTLILYTVCTDAHFARSSTALRELLVLRFSPLEAHHLHLLLELSRPRLLAYVCGEHGQYLIGTSRTYPPIGRGWPRLAEATGRLGLELALAGRIKAGQGESAKSARAMQLGDCWPCSSVPVARAWRWSRCRSTRLRASGESSV